MRRPVRTGIMVIAIASALLLAFRLQLFEGIPFLSGSGKNGSADAPPAGVGLPRGYSFKTFPPGGRSAAMPMADEGFPSSAEEYATLPGVLTFRGDHHRSGAAYGRVRVREERLQVIWRYGTAASTWGGGTGWTGQPVLVRWPQETRAAMNLRSPYRDDPGFVEAICGSLSGEVYFLDLQTGRPTRDPIQVGNPIKGSVSVHPAGYPLLFVGDGINETEEFGFRAYSLVDGRRLLFLSGKDPRARVDWGAFDSSVLVSLADDRLLVGGENGLFYSIRLNTSFGVDWKGLSLRPQITRYRYHLKGIGRHGIESSAAASGKLAWFANNSGMIHCLDLESLQPRWVLPPADDTDAGITVDIEKDVPYLYTGCEVDLQGTKGSAIIRKIDGLTGRMQWKRSYRCYSVKGERPVNGGILATNVVGRHDLRDLVVFTIARWESHNRGLMVALDKADGREVWRWEMPHYAWSSPVDIYTPGGKGYIVQGDSTGRLHLLDGADGRLLHSIDLGANIEGSPAVYEDMLVVGTRGGIICGVRIR